MVLLANQYRIPSGCTTLPMDVACQVLAVHVDFAGPFQGHTFPIIVDIKSSSQ